MSERTRSYLLAGLAAQAALTAAVVVIVGASVDASGRDLALLVLFLLASGGATLGLGFVALHRGLPLAHSMRRRMGIASGLTAGLALANVGIVASLMFLSTHDLIVLAALIAFALGMSLFVSYSFAEGIAGGISQLNRAVQRLNAGTLDARAEVRSADEIGELAQAFNDMASRLEGAFARERDLERSRRDLITAVSHDLRTPLASMRAMIESINDGVVEDQSTVTRYLRQTQSEIESLSALIDDLFELSRLDAGVLELHLEEASIHDLVSDTLSAMAAQASSHQLTLEGEVSPQVPAVMVDTRRLQRVLLNLVQNSIRHTPPDGTISIRVLDAGSEIEVQVVDTGEGIGTKDLPEIFERFYRADESRSRDSGGAGLGLSIAKGIVEAHGGRIWADSTLKRGSALRFTLPKAGARTS